MVQVDPEPPDLVLFRREALSNRTGRVAACSRVPCHVQQLRRSMDSELCTMRTERRAQTTLVLGKDRQREGSRRYDGCSYRSREKVFLCRLRARQLPGASLSRPQFVLKVALHRPLNQYVSRTGLYCVINSTSAELISAWVFSLSPCISPGDQGGKCTRLGHIKPRRQEFHSPTATRNTRARHPAAPYQPGS